MSWFQKRDNPHTAEVRAEMAASGFAVLPEGRVLLPGGVDADVAQAAAENCQSILGGTWVPPTEAQRLATQGALRVAAGGANLPWGADYLTAPEAARREWAVGGVGQGDVWAASEMPYAPWGYILNALDLLARLAAALPVVVTWAPEPDAGMVLLRGVVGGLSATPADVDALENAASLVTLAWSEALRTTFDQLATLPLESVGRVRGALLHTSTRGLGRAVHQALPACAELLAEGLADAAELLAATALTRIPPELAVSAGVCAEACKPNFAGAAAGVPVVLYPDAADFSAIPAVADVVLPGGVPLQWAYEAAVGCQSIVDGTWAPRTEPGRLALQDELRMAVDGIALPWGVQYLSAPLADRRTWAAAGVGHGEVWSASPMPYMPWGDVLAALSLLANLAEALPEVAAWDENVIDVLVGRVVQMSAYPYDAAALRGAAALVTLAWAEAFRVLIVGSDDEAENDAPATAGSSPELPPGTPYDQLAGCVPPPALSLAALQSYIDDCASYHPTRTSGGREHTPWVAVRSAMLGLSPVTDGAGSPVSPQEVRRLVGGVADATSKASWLAQMARNAEGLLGPGAAAGAMSAQRAVRGSLKRGDLRGLRRNTTQLRSALVDLGVLQQGAPRDAGPAAPTGTPPAAPVSVPSTGATSPRRRGRGTVDEPTVWRPPGR